MTEQCKTYKVLIIDDDRPVRETLMDALQEQNDWRVEESEFDQAEDLLRTFRPDMIVLDLVVGLAQEGDPVGNQIFERIREIWFCPVVVYSAAVARKKFEHPLVKTVDKGEGSDIEVLQYLNEFRSIAERIYSIHSDFDVKIRTALHDSARHLPDDSYLTDDSHVLMRNVRRLVAARTDIGSGENVKLEAWERFVMPPLGEHLLTADLLRKKGADWKDINDFRLVLTPSCDMVWRETKEGLKVNVDQILVACCEPLLKLGKVKLSGELSKNKKKTLRPILNEGISNSCIPIPCLNGCVPSMQANLKRLELIGWDKLCLGSSSIEGERDGCEYERVASTDSPFREMVVWAYLRVSGRPGLPNVDIDGWLEDIWHGLPGAKQS